MKRFQQSYKTYKTYGTREAYTYGTQHMLAIFNNPGEREMVHRCGGGGRGNMGARPVGLAPPGSRRGSSRPAALPLSSSRACACAQPRELHPCPCPCPAARGSAARKLGPAPVPAPGRAAGELRPCLTIGGEEHRR